MRPATILLFLFHFSQIHAQTYLDKAAYLPFNHHTQAGMGWRLTGIERNLSAKIHPLDRSHCPGGSYSLSHYPGGRRLSVWAYLDTALYQERPHSQLREE